MNTKAGPAFPLEPVLDVEEIQGIVVPGFFKPHQILLGVRYDRAHIDKLLSFIRDLAPGIANAAETLRDRRGHREGTAEAKAAPSEWPPLVAIAFSFRGLFDLTPGADAIPSPAFKNGLARRSALLGDPTDPKNPGHPSKWHVGGPTTELDILIIVAGDTRRSVKLRAAEIERALAGIKAKVISQAGDIREDMPGHEHFGFDDGVSQPGIRGRASKGPSDFITDRHVDASEFPAAAMMGYPGQDLVWPGEFVIGYPQTGPDPLIPGPVLAPVPDWTRNGSFLVYRRLRQDVGLFWRTMREQAERLSGLPGFAGLDDVGLAARLVGRWRSGAPLSRSPAKDNPDLGRAKLANNHFRFDSDTPSLELTDGTDEFGAAKADPIGVVCPLAAHIRKVNTRDAPSDTGGRGSTYERRLLRVGVPFGPSLKDRYAKASAKDPERGLLFLSIQTSIEEQFEFLQARWMNDDSRPKAPSGHDMIVGQNAPTSDGVRRCVLFGSGLQQAMVEAPGQFVTPTGGGYFFVPSKNALSAVIGAEARRSRVNSRPKNAASRS
jgi:Dyp-type peroxidase family